MTPFLWSPADFPSEVETSMAKHAGSLSQRGLLVTSATITWRRIAF